MLFSFLLFCQAVILGIQALVPIPLEPQKPCFTHFGECLRYCPGERIPDIEGIESSCITNQAGYQFCKFYHCPPSKCKGRKKDLYGKCYYCPGTCVDGGRIHNNGQAFMSFDCVNSCFCGQENSKHCTKHPVDQYAYCNHARPGSDGDNGMVVMVEEPKVKKETQIVAVVQQAPPPPEQPEVIAVVAPPPPQPRTQPVVVVQQPPPPPPTQANKPPPPPPPAYQPTPPPYHQHHQPNPPQYHHQPTAPPNPPQYAYVPPPTAPPTPHGIAYVPPPPSQPPAQQHAYVPTPPPAAPQEHYPRMVAHPNFSARSPKSNLQQRSNRHPNVYRNTHQSPKVHAPPGHHGNQQHQHYPGQPGPYSQPYQYPPPTNPFYGPGPFNFWGFKKKEKEMEA